MRVIWLFILLVIFNFSNAQLTEITADQYIASRLYPEAIVQLKEDISNTSISSEKQKSFMKMGLCFYKMHNYAKSNTEFAKAQATMQNWPKKYQETYFHSLRTEKRYEEAGDVLSTCGLSNLWQGQFVKFAQEENKVNTKFKLNKTNTEFGESFMGIAEIGGDMVLSKPVKNKEDKTVGYDLYPFGWSADSTIGASKIKPLLDKQEEVLFRGNPAYINEKIIIYTQSVSRVEKYKVKKIEKTNLAESGENVLQLRAFNIEKQELESVVGLNDENNNNVTPYFWKENKVLFFASDRTGDSVGYEIYYATLQGDSWSQPVLLEGVNTDFDEVYPMIQGDQFYFSSRGGNNYGGLDVFVGDMVQTGSEFKVQNVKNMGAPINSSFDDFSLYWKDKSKGYVASNRAGENGKDELYYFKYISDDSLRIVVFDGSENRIDANVKISKKDKDGNWVFEKSVQIGKNGIFTYLTDPDEKYRFEIEADGYIERTLYVPSEEADELRADAKDGLGKVILKEILFQGRLRDAVTEKELDGVTVNIYEINDGNKELIATIVTGADGLWDYPFNRNKEYEVEMIARNFEREIFEIPSSSNRERPNFLAKLKDVYIQPETKEGDVLTIDNIYFEFNSAEITKESLPILGNVIKLLNKKPELRIELSAHTDCVGSDSYNLKLSQKRAKSCFEYLVQEGIDADRLKPVGYGEKFIKNGCIKSGQCSEEENKVNRRIEVKFI